MPRRQTVQKKQRNLVYAIAGLHGVGKSTALNLLRQKHANEANWFFFNERKRHRDFITFGSKDPQKAFRSEFHFVQNMTIRNTDISRRISSGSEKICIMDRSPISVLVYSAALNMDPNDYRLIVDMYESVNWHEDYIIYLEASLQAILRRIQTRGSLDTQRLEWNEEDMDYAKKILENYEHYFRQYNIVRKVVRVNTTNLTRREVFRAVDEIIREKAGLACSTSPLSQRVQNKLDRWA